LVVEGVVMRAARLTFLAVLLITVISSCTTSTPNQDNQTENLQTQINGYAVSVDPKKFETLDEKFIKVAQQLPNFAGFHYNESGQIVVSMKASVNQRLPVSKDVVKEQIATVFGQELFTQTVLGETARVPIEITIKPVQFDITELTNAFQKLTGLMSQKGMVFIDVDEKANRVFLGVENNQIGVNVQKQLNNLGIPSSLVVTEIVSPVQPTASVRDYVRPIAGGLQIATNKYFCTLGFRAKRGTQVGFVTNSHCTNTQGGVESTSFYQPTVVAGNQIGVETIDPAYWSGGSCPSGKVCRYSDSAFILMSAGVTSASGVANVTSYATGFGSLGSLTIDPALPVINFTGQDPYKVLLTVGRVVYKVGRTSGGTKGTVQRTCVDTNVAGGNFYFKCQATATYTSQGGDSGSPVWTMSTLVGLNWGSTATEAFLSPVDGIWNELGKLEIRP
jgi:hypothetical protein